MLTVNDWPALAVTPHTATFCVAASVFERAYLPKANAPVGASVGVIEGAGVGAVGAAVGTAEGSPGRVVGPGDG